MTAENQPPQDDLHHRGGHGTLVAAQRNEYLDRRCIPAWILTTHILTLSPAQSALYRAPIKLFSIPSSQPNVPRDVARIFDPRRPRLPTY
jgi:hypothetical protein